MTITLPMSLMIMLITCSPKSDTIILVTHQQVSKSMCCTSWEEAVDVLGGLSLNGPVLSLRTGVKPGQKPLPGRFPLLNTVDILACINHLCVKLDLSCYRKRVFMLHLKVKSRFSLARFTSKFTKNSLLEG